MVRLQVITAFLFFISPSILLSQDIAEADSSRVLEAIEIKAYAHRKPAEVIPAAVTVLRQAEMERFSNSNLLPVLNMSPGVRMEERSPGSYRLSIRGSSLRSPFGVRNVKIYWNGIPFTDPGGNTYLNLLDFSSVNQAEIIRGPGSSQYGAGMGGVLLLESLPLAEKSRDEMIGGSYGMFRIAGSTRFGTNEKYVQIRLAQQQSEGYRTQSAMKRFFLQVEGRKPLNESTVLSFHALASDLFYETPGGLTLEQFNEDPTQARPASGQNASAVDQRAAIYNKTIFGGIHLEHDWGKNWNTLISVGANYTDFENPAIRNYEERTEKSFSLRMVTDRRFNKSKLTFGTELQSGNGNIALSTNDRGKKGDLTSKTFTPLRTGLAFAQFDLDLPGNILLTSGLSLNRFSINFEQTVSNVKSNSSALSEWILIPRAGISKKITRHLTGYAQIGKGFSPPTTAEFFPSTAIFNPNLQAESGYSSEAGLKGNFQSINFTLNAFRLRLNNTIVVRRDEAGADYFVNAGTTLQRGLEGYFKLRFTDRTDLLKNLSIWASPSLNFFEFENYQQGSSDLSGNQLTGTPKIFGTSGIDFSNTGGFYIQFTSNYCGALPLDDRNTVYASEYWTFGLRGGYRIKSGRYPVEFMAGADNITDRKYSLGNDLNAAGGRFFNAAPGRSFYAGIIIRQEPRKRK